MVRLREIPRTAAFAWSPGSAPPLLATGTRAGAIDDDFSNDTNLELWDLQLDQLDASTDLSPVGTISTDSRCVPHSWTRYSSDTDVDSTTLHGVNRPPIALVVSLPAPLKMALSIYGTPRSSAPALPTHSCLEQQSTLEPSRRFNSTTRSTTFLRLLVPKESCSFTI